MKTKYLIIIISVLLALCIGISTWLLWPREPGKQAEIISSNQVIRTVDLSKNETFTVDSANGGKNTVQIQDGKIAVIDADCPDHICMEFGWCDSGMPIVCLPNGLIINFLSDEIDGIAG